MLPDQRLDFIQVSRYAPQDEAGSLGVYNAEETAALHGQHPIASVSQHPAGDAAEVRNLNAVVLPLYSGFGVGFFDEALYLVEFQFQHEAGI